MSYEIKMGKATRNAYGEALAEIGRDNPNVVVLDGDLSKSTMTKHFAAEFPDRFFNMGIAEANMVSAAAGLALSGKIPFASSFSSFLLCKGFDQIRMGIAYPKANVKLVGSHGGISLGEDGASQQSVEDVALACALPGFTVIVPADEVDTGEAIRAAAELDGPVYVRVGRPKAPIVHPSGTAGFEIGKAIRLRDGGDVTIIANGLMVSAALQAADELSSRGIEARVLNMATVKPLDEEAVEAAARETGRIVVAEEHLLHGGLGSVVATAVGRLHPVPLSFVSLPDTYAQSGKPEELFEKYGITPDAVVSAAQQLVERGTVRA